MTHILSYATPGAPPRTRHAAIRWYAYVSNAVSVLVGGSIFALTATNNEYAGLRSAELAAGVAVGQVLFVVVPTVVILNTAKRVASLDALAAMGSVAGLVGSGLAVLLGLLTFLTTDWCC